MARPPRDESFFHRQLRLRVEYLREQGLDYAVDRPELHPAVQASKATPEAVSEATAPPPAPVQPQSAQRPHRKAASSAPQAPAPDAATTEALAAVTGSRGNPAASLQAIRDILGECSRCRLSKGRTQIVFGVGSPTARLMFVGEGPGAEEDAQGEPFVGKAGKLLTEIITKGMGLRREEVYIANVVKCRPPENRDPLPDEVEACYPFLRAQILAIRPEVIVTLGKPASHTLLFTTTPISRLRGEWASYEGIPVMPTFHPSYLLRNPSAKKSVWEDIQKVMARLGIARPGTK